MPLALIIIRACFEHIKPILRAISETLKWIYCYWYKKSYTQKL
jgi:hypothetical protein